MKSKISNKPDENASSPLKATPFPLDLSRFQTSFTSQSKKSSTPLTELSSIHFVSTKLEEASPNFFQYNDRSPLILSSDDEGNDQPHFNYYDNMGETTRQYKEVPMPNLKKNDEKANIDSKKQAKKQESNYISQQNVALPIKQPIKQTIKVEVIKKQSKKSENNEKMQQISIQKIYQVNKSSNHSFSNKINLIAPSPQNVVSEKTHQIASSKDNKQQYTKPIKQEGNLIVSKSEDIFNKPQAFQHPLQHQNENQSSVKQQSSVFSKTDEIIQRVNLNNNNQNILIEEQSNQQSEKYSEHSHQSKDIYYLLQTPHTPHSAMRDSVQTNPAQPQRKRRNRIFDNSTLKNKSNKQDFLTPEKGVQTQTHHNNSFSNQEAIKSNDYYPQIKALDVLNKIVDQINPNQTRITTQLNRSLNQSFSHQKDLIVLGIQELSNTISLFKGIKSIDRVQEVNLSRARKLMKQRLKEEKLFKRIYKRKDDEMVQNQLALINAYSQLNNEFEIIDETAQSFIQSKYRLAHLMETSKGLMVIMRRGEFKKIYYILSEIAIEIEKLKAMRATCGTHKIQKLFKQYLETQIAQLSQVERQMRFSFEDIVPNFRV